MPEEIAVEATISRAKRLGVDLSWLERAREHREEEEQRRKERGSASCEPKHPLKLCWVPEGSRMYDGAMMYLLVRYCRHCRLAEGVRLEQSHEGYPVVRRVELNIITTGIPEICPAKELEKAIKNIGQINNEVPSN